MISTEQRLFCEAQTNRKPALVHSLNQDMMLDKDITVLFFVIVLSLLLQ